MVSQLVRRLGAKFHVDAGWNGPAWSGQRFIDRHLIEYPVAHHQNRADLPCAIPLSTGLDGDRAVIDNGGVGAPFIEGLEETMNRSARFEECNQHRMWKRWGKVPVPD